MANGNEGAGSDKAELKKLLRVARDQPVNMALALGADGKAIIKLDKLKPPRALEKLLKEQDGSKNHRFGTVTLDPADDKLARFTVNKAGGGLARKLTVALKGTGVSKVVLASEDGAVEQAEEEEDEAPSASAAPAPAPAAAEPADPALPRKLAKAGQVWEATVAKITRDLEQLVAEAVKAGGGHALADGLDRHVRDAATPLLQILQGKLSRLLAAAAGAKDEATRGKLLEGARREAEQLRAFAQSSPVVAHLDENPFTQPVIGKTLHASLSAVTSVIH